MIIPNGTEDQHIARHKQKLGLIGDVYLIDDHKLESLESHNRSFPGYEATSIQEAEQKRIQYEEDQEAIRQAEQEQQLEQNNEEEQGNEEDGEGEE